jgi:hypothetical protein
MADATISTSTSVVVDVEATIKAEVAKAVAAMKAEESKLVAFVKAHYPKVIAAVGGWALGAFHVLEAAFKLI